MRETLRDLAGVPPDDAAGHHRETERRAPGLPRRVGHDPRERSRASSTDGGDGVVLVGEADCSATVRGFARPPTMIGGCGCWSRLRQDVVGVGPLTGDLGQLPVELVEPVARGPEREPVRLVLGSYQPAPIPSSTRPPDTWSTVTTFFASTDAGRNVTGETIVPSRIRSVRAASAASVAQASSEPAGSPSTMER